MKVSVCYTFPMVNHRIYYALAQRFAETYRQFPAGYPHELNVICNGGPPSETDQKVFNGLPAQFRPRDNGGWDIGGYQWAAETIPCDLMVCLGAPAHFYQANWLERMVDVFIAEGPHLYGCWGYQSPDSHIRTTVFWCHPALIRSYPYLIGSHRASRYGFEHGRESITRWVLKAGLRALVVSFTGIWDHPWTGAKFGLGDCLCLDQFTHR